MYVIGLTGGIGSGKSTVAALFAKKGITIIDADQITRDLTRSNQPALQKIIGHFSQQILNPDGTLDRAKLRKIIFDLPDEKRWLENLLHPLVRIAMKQQALSATSPYCIAMIPLLLETEKNLLIDRILIVDAPEEIQLQRTEARDKLSKDHLQAILEAQMRREERLTLAHDIIDNSGDRNALLPQVDKLHEFYLSLSRTA